MRRLLVELRELRVEFGDLLDLLVAFRSHGLAARAGVRWRVYLAALGAQFLQNARAVEDAGQRVVVGLRDRIELVVVAAGTAERQAQERLADRVDLVVDHVADHLLLVGVAAVPGAVDEERRGDQPVGVDLLARRELGSRSPAIWWTMNWSNGRSRLRASTTQSR